MNLRLLQLETHGASGCDHGGKTGACMCQMALLAKYVQHLQSADISRLATSGLFISFQNSIAPKHGKENQCILDGLRDSKA